MKMLLRSFLGLTSDAVMTMGKLYEKPQNALNTQESSSRQPHQL